MLRIFIVLLTFAFCGSLADARPRGLASVAAAQTIQGNPNVVVSAINVSPTPVTFTATTTNGSRSLTSVSSTSGLLLGMVCTGTGLPTNPVTLMAADPATSVVFLSHAATASATVTISCGANAIYGTRFTCEGAGDQSRSGTKAGGCAIQVSMDGLGLTGTNANGLAVRPYQDAEICWDFGDPSGIETFTRPTDGATVNANSAQCGPQAAYMYRDTTTTTHTITATIRVRNGGTATSPTYTTTIATQSVVVTAFANTATYYVDFNNGLTTNDCTAAVQGAGNVGPCKLLRNLNAKITSGHRTFLFAEGSKWDCSTMTATPADTDCLGPTSSGSFSGLRFGSYQGASGAGAKPQINVTGAGCALCGFNGAMFNPSAAGTKDDFTFSNLKISTPTGSTTATGGFLSVAPNTSGSTHMDWYYFDNVDFENYAAVPTNNLPAQVLAPGVFSVGWTVTQNVGTAQGFGVWGGTTKNSLNYSLFNGTVSQSDGIVTPSVYDTILTVNSTTSGRNDDGSACSSACLKVGAGILSSSIPFHTSSSFTGSTSAGVNQITVTGVSGGRLGRGTQITNGGVPANTFITTQASGTAGSDGVYNLNQDPGTHSPTTALTSVFVQSQVSSNVFIISAFNNVAAQAMYGAASYYHLFLGGPQDWSFNYFQSMTGNGEYDPTVLIHFVYPETLNHSLFKWVNFGRTGYGGGTLDAGISNGGQYNYCINGISSEPASAFQNLANLGFMGNMLISEVKCGTDGFSDTSAAYMLDLSDANNSPTAQGYQVRNVVVEKSAMANVSAGGSGQPISPTMDNWGITFRDNRVWTKNAMIFPGGNIAGNFALMGYRNKIYEPSTTIGSPLTQTAPAAQTASAVTNGSATFTIGSICPFPYNSRVFFSGANLNGAWTAGSGTTNLFWIVSTDGTATCSVSSSSGGSVVNASASSTGTFSVTQVWNAPWEITDNVIQDDRALPIFYGTIVLNNNNGTTGNTSLFDRNAYSFPGASLGTNNVGFGGNTYSTWSGAPNNFDQNSAISTSAPSGWTCAASANWSCFGP